MVKKVLCTAAHFQRKQIVKVGTIWTTTPPPSTLPFPVRVRLLQGSLSFSLQFAFMFQFVFVVFLVFSWSFGFSYVRPYSVKKDYPLPSPAAFFHVCVLLRQKIVVDGLPPEFHLVNGLYRFDGKHNNFSSYKRDDPIHDIFSRVYHVSDFWVVGDMDDMKSGSNRGFSSIQSDADEPYLVRGEWSARNCRVELKVNVLHARSCSICAVTQRSSLQFSAESYQSRFYT